MKRKGTHSVAVVGFGGQTDCNYDDDGEDEETEGEVHVVEVGQPRRSLLSVATAGGPEHHVHHHPRHANHEAHAQTPERTLDTKHVIVVSANSRRRTFD